MPDITLYFLQASRCIRTAWQLEELGLGYKVEFTERENGKAPQHFKDNSGDALGKFPLIKDGSLTVAESGAIAEYVKVYKVNSCLGRLLIKTQIPVREIRHLEQIASYRLGHTRAVFTLAPRIGSHVCAARAGHPLHALVRYRQPSRSRED